MRMRSRRAVEVVKKGIQLPVAKRPTCRSLARSVPDKKSAGGGLGSGNSTQGVDFAASLMAAPMSSEAEAGKWFDNGVDTTDPLSTKVDHKRPPRVCRLRRQLPGGKVETVGYRVQFWLFKRGHVAPSAPGGYSRGAKKSSKTSLRTYPTEEKAKGRMYRDVWAYVDSKTRARQPAADEKAQRDRRARDDRATRGL